MRLFTSIDFSDDILEEVRSWIPDLEGWRRTSKHQMHLTLVFFGDCSEEEAKEIHTVLSGIRFSPFPIIVQALGAFPNEDFPRIIWAGVSKSDGLMKLQCEISSQLGKYIRPEETYSYKPHITLARKKWEKGINNTVKKSLARQTPKLSILVDSYHLKKSILKPAGSEHYILHQYGAIPGR